MIGSIRLYQSLICLFDSSTYTIWIYVKKFYLVCHLVLLVLKFLARESLEILLFNDK